MKAGTVSQKKGLIRFVFPALFVTPMALSGVWGSGPLSPQNFKGVATQPDQIHWTWDRQDDVHFYALFDGSSRQKIAQTDHTYLYEDNLTPNQPVTRFLYSGGKEGLSAESSSLVVYTLARQPTDLKATQIEMDSLTLTWNANGNPPDTFYRLQRSQNGVDYTDVSHPRGGVSHWDEGLKPNTPYQYRVQAINGEGLETDFTAPVEVQTSQKTDFVSPQKVGGVRKTLHFSNTVITLMWDPVTHDQDGRVMSDLKGYHVYRTKNLGDTPQRLTRRPIQATVFADVLNNQDYAYSVRAVDHSGNESSDSEVLYSGPTDQKVSKRQVYPVTGPLSPPEKQASAGR